MTIEEYGKRYRECAKEFGQALAKNVARVKLQESVRVGVMPIHLGNQLCLAELNALVPLLIAKGLFTTDEYQEAVLNSIQHETLVLNEHLNNF